jgi:hypothetical protein
VVAEEDSTMNKAALAAASAALLLASISTQPARAEIVFYPGHTSDKSFGFEGYDDNRYGSDFSFWSKHSHDHIYSDYGAFGDYLSGDWWEKRFAFWGFWFPFFDFDHGHKKHGCGSGGDGGDGGVGITTPNIPGVVPEPATWAMMFIGLFGIGGMMRRTRRPALVTARLEA